MLRQVTGICIELCYRLLTLWRIQIWIAVGEIGSVHPLHDGHDPLVLDRALGREAVDEAGVAAGAGAKHERN